MDLGLALAVSVCLDPGGPSAADAVELPVPGRQQPDELLDSLLVGLVGEVRAERAATVVRAIGVDALAARAEDAGPARCQPGEIAAIPLVALSWVVELDPGAWEVKGYFRHVLSLSTDLSGCSGHPDAGVTLTSGSAPEDRASATNLEGMREAVLDVGSNTAHLLVVDAYRGAPPLPASSMKKPLRLAEAITDGGALSEDGVESLVSFVGEALVWAEDRVASPSWPLPRRRSGGRRTPTRSSLW